MSKPAPVYVVTYNRSAVSIYTQAWRVVVCMRVLLAEKLVSDPNLFRVVRFRLAKDSEILTERLDVTDSFLKALSSYGVSA